MSIFECPIPGCGRRFKDEAKLDEHLQRRHADEAKNLKDISNNFESETSKTEKIDKATLRQKKAELLAQEKEMQETLGKLEDQEEEVKFSMNDILESQKKLTKEFLLSKTGTDNLEDITQLILREENLYHFDDTPKLSVDDLCNLEYLALSHNKLTVTTGISKLANLLELNINFNLIEDITPLNECLNLEKLYASNNKIKTISGIRDLTRLKCLSLTKNKLNNFEETALVLATFPCLQELDLDRNPCTRKFTYKYDLLFHVRVEKLDGERINPVDFELARTFKGEGSEANSEPTFEEEQSKQGNTAPLNRPSTAPGRVRQANFVTKLKGRLHGADMGMLNIPENVNSEKVAELEQELEVLKERLNAAEVELEETRGRESLLKLENDKLNNQVNILKVEASSAYILMDQNQQLKKELQSLKVIFSNKDDIKDAKKENLLLHEQIAELIKENQELKTKLEKQGIVKTEQKEIDIKERLVRKKERVLPESRNSSTSQDTKPTHFIIRSGQASPKANLVRTISSTNTRVTPTKPIRGISEGKIPEDKDKEKTTTKAVVQEGSGRKIIRVVPPRQGTPTQINQSREMPDEGEELLDSEIEELLIRNSLQLSQLRSELRNFDFLEKKEGKNIDDGIEGNDEDDEDEQETIDTSVQLETTSKARRSQV